MCYRPIHIKNKSSYPVEGLSLTGYDVPCGRCLECQQMRKQEWQTRIAFELSSLYRNGGRAVFLTFTYNNECLPVYTDDGFDVSRFHPEFTKSYPVPGHPGLVRQVHTHTPFSVPCFNHRDVLSFLNRVKVGAFKRYGPNSYRYFFCSEYGKTTRRPHYHAIFFLAPQVNWQTFVEMCREKWSYGFMFPKYDIRRKCYIDKDNKPMGDEKPCIGALGGCSKYVSKYITKDMSYYGRTDVAYYLSVPGNKNKMAQYLPKHWQSNNLGISVIDELNMFDEEQVKEVLTLGVLNPLTLKYVPFPQFALNRLMFENVKSPRVSEKTNKPLYDRFLTDFGRLYMYTVFRSRVVKTAQKMSEAFQSTPLQSLHPDKIAALRFCKFDTRHRSLDYKLFGITDVTSASCFIPFAIYRTLYRYAPVNIVYNVLKIYGGDISKLFDIDIAFSYWMDNKDTEYLKHRHYFKNSGVHKPKTIAYMDFFRPYEFVCRGYEQISAERSKRLCEERQRKLNEIELAKAKFTNRFDNKLC